MLTNEILKQLNERQVYLMTFLYNECINNTSYTASNFKLSESVDIPVSTLEKYLNHLEKLHFIVRHSEIEHDQSQNRWYTGSRSISLDPNTFPPEAICMERQVRAKAMLNMIDTKYFQTEAIKDMYEKRGKLCEN